MSSPAKVFLLLLLLVPTLPAALAQTARLEPVTVARGLVHPWGLAFLPDGRMLVTERPGRMRIVARGRHARRADRRAAARRRLRPGRTARRRARPEVRRQRPHLLDLQRAGRRRQGRQQHRSGARAARRQPARRRRGHLPPAAEGREHAALRLAARVRARRHALHRARRSLHAQGRRADARHAPRQGRAHRARRQGAGRQPVRRPGGRAARDLELRPPQHPGRRASTPPPARCG